MKAAIYHEYGPPNVLKIEDVEKPVPKDDEVLIRNRATTVTAGDVKLRSFNMPWFYKIPMGLYMGFRHPKIKILGTDIAGEVVKSGKTVKKFKKGDRVFGGSDFKMSAYAEYIALAEKSPITGMPKMRYEEAAAIPFGASTAVYFLKKAGLKKGDKILIYGASGAVGTAAVQVAKFYGAYVTAVCGSDSMELVKALGADEVIDYKTEDFTNTGPYDIVYETVGKSSYDGCMSVLKPKGIFIMGAVFKLSWYLKSLGSMFSSRKVVAGVAVQNQEMIEEVREMVEQKALRPVIDKVYRLDDIAKAHAYVDKGHKKGNVVIKI